MGHATTLSIWIACAALLGMAVGLRAEDTTAPGDRGRAHIEQTCVRCHAGATLDALVRAKVGDRDLTSALDDFLARHHAADPALRADVLVALQARLAEGE